MIRILFGLFLALHGLVHLLYFGQSARFFELKPGMVWPDGSWAFSRLLGDDTARVLACIALALAALGFLAGGIGFLAEQPWRWTVAAGAAVLSVVIYILFWDGALQALDGKGAVGILIDAAVLAAVLIFRWPK